MSSNLSLDPTQVLNSALETLRQALDSALSESLAVPWTDRPLILYAQGLLLAQIAPSGIWPGIKSTDLDLQNGSAEVYQQGNQLIMVRIPQASLPGGNALRHVMEMRSFCYKMGELCSKSGVEPQFNSLRLSAGKFLLAVRFAIPSLEVVPRLQGSWKEVYEAKVCLTTATEDPTLVVGEWTLQQGVTSGA